MSPDEAEPIYTFSDKIISATLVVGGIIGIAYLALNDFTIIGIGDDIFIPSLVTVVWENANIILN